MNDNPMSPGDEFKLQQCAAAAAEREKGNEIGQNRDHAPERHGGAAGNSSISLDISQFRVGSYVRDGPSPRSSFHQSFQQLGEISDIGSWARMSRGGQGLERRPGEAMAYYANFEGLPMPTRNVVLTEQQERFIETLVKSGRYQNASEVLRDGPRLVEQRETEEAARLEALREAARIGASALDRGEWKEFESIEDLQTYLNDLSAKVISSTGG